MVKRTLIIGYGNPDREDDGVAWHILLGLAKHLERPLPESFSEGFEESGQNPELMFDLQLTPEMAEIVAGYEQVCFVDAHTGAVPEDVHVEAVSGIYQSSPFTHHMTPQTMMSLVESLYGKHPAALLVSVRGYQFGFQVQLSEATARLAEEAERVIWDWLQGE